MGLGGGGGGDFGVHVDEGEEDVVDVGFCVGWAGWSCLFAAVTGRGVGR